MDKRIRALLLICFVMIFAAQVVSAEESKELKIYNTRLVTNDKEATYIEGEVPISNGQTILLKAGLRVLAERQLPNTGMASKFKIKVPSKNISEKNVSVVYVQERNGDLQGKAERVEIEYKERKKQRIATDNKEYSLTYPGLDSNISAKATSGEKLTYTSSNPEVVQVDENGTLVAKGEGEAEVSVKQIGSSSFEEAEEKVKVSVEGIDAYTITFHSSDDANAVSKQIVPRNGSGVLQPNTFENGSHQFLGWAEEDGGLRVYKDGAEIDNLAERGGNTDLYAVWTGDGPEAAVAWAIDIADDDSFTYGKKPETNKIGCYFCGTNQKNKPKGYEKTYVCLTFVAAAYAHGAEDPEVYYACSHGKMPLYENDRNFTQFSCWTKIGKCKNLSISDLEPGDVVISWSAHSDNSGHTWMYAGGDQIVESTGGGFTAKSIALKEGASKRLKSYGRNSKNYVMRYTGANS